MNLNLKIKNPIFIVGTPHGGTSILTSMLSMLNNIYTFPGESTIFYHKNYKSLEIIEKDTFKNNKKRFLEKSPCHIDFIDDIFRLYPESKIILMSRDGKDVITSLLRRKWPINKCINRWVDVNKKILQWSNHKNTIVVKYEDLIKDTEKELKRICNFIEEPYQNNLLEYYKQPKLWYDKKIEKPKDISDNPKLRNWQINQPLFDGRGKWKKELSDKNIEILKNHKEFNDIMNKIGYDFNYNKDK